MEDLNWKEKYSVGVFEIDAEHKIFLKTIKKINLAFEKSEDGKILKLLLEELYKYADFHFTSEENVMIMNAYPDYAPHKEQHDELMQKLANMINFFDVNSIDKDKLIQFLVQWFKEHTASVDLELGKFLRENENSRLVEHF